MHSAIHIISMHTFTKHAAITAQHIFISLMYFDINAMYVDNYTQRLSARNGVIIANVCGLPYTPF